MKKLISLLLCLAFVFALAACGDSAQTDESSKQQTGTAKATAIAIEAETLSVAVDETVTVKATITPADGAVKWSSSDTDVAVVNVNGVVTGIAAGTATITCASEDGSVSDKVTVSVSGGYGSINFVIDAQREDGYIEVYPDTLAHALLVPVDAKPLDDSSSIVSFITNKYENGIRVFDANNLEARIEADDIPAGEYLLMVVSSYSYKRTLASDILTKEGYDKYFTASDLATLYNNIKEQEVAFEKITIVDGETYKHKYTDEFGVEKEGSFTFYNPKYAGL